MLEVFRVEHASTFAGPFRPETRKKEDEAFHAKLAELAWDANLPIPMEDGIVTSQISPFCVYGCENLDTLKKWILVGSTKAKDVSIVSRLKKLGYVVNKYLVDEDDVHKGESGLQVAFYPPYDARDNGQYESIDLVALLNE